MTKELVDIEMMAHGGSVIEVRKRGGKWAVVEASPYNRRITVDTPMRISGPAAGHRLMRTNADENRQIGEWLARAANAATGPVQILLPLKGVSMLDSAGERFWDPAADQACFDAIKQNVRSGIQVSELDNNINDPAFAEACARTLLAMLG